MKTAPPKLSWIGARSASKGIFLALLVTSASAAQQEKLTAPPNYPSHSDLSYYLRPDGIQVPIQSPADWQQRRAHILAGMQQAMGPLPHPKSPLQLSVQILEEHQDDG